MIVAMGFGRHNRRMKIRYTTILVFLWSLLPGVLSAALPAPMPPVDTSSPRSTLFGFISRMDERYSEVFGPTGFVTTYLASNALFMDPATTQLQMSRIHKSREMTAKYLNLGHIPIAVLKQQSWRLTIQLKEILDRMSLPDPASVPDSAAMQSMPYKKWKLPDSDLTIALVESGPRAGEYLFSQETVDQIPSIFNALKQEPYYGGQGHGVYDTIFMKPAGFALFLAKLVPSRWFLEGDPWTNRPLFGEPIWRWFALALLFGLMGGFYWATLRLSERLSQQKKLAGLPWTLLPTMSLLLMVPACDHILDEILLITPRVYFVLTEGLWGLNYLALATLVWGLCRWLTEWVIKLERIKADSTDSQLLRLGSRLVALSIVIAILIEGANRIGLPSYSIMAGLGIGGLAVALAGQQALANLLGSLIIMFEKPFRIGHTIKTGSLEGQVENIGFRTTQLRTGDGTALIVPSSELIRTPIENLTLRKHWRVKKSLKVGLSTSLEALSAFKQGIEALLLANPSVHEKSIRISLAEILAEGLEIRIEFKLEAKNATEQLRQSDAILMQIIELARSSNIGLDPAAVSTPS